MNSNNEQDFEFYLYMRPSDPNMDRRGKCDISTTTQVNYSVYYSICYLTLVLVECTDRILYFTALRCYFHSLSKALYALSRANLSVGLWSLYFCKNCCVLNDYLVANFYSCKSLWLVFHYCFQWIAVCGSVCHLSTAFYLGRILDLVVNLKLCMQCLNWVYSVIFLFMEFGPQSLK
jgi:hypothetical protein